MKKFSRLLSLVLAVAMLLCATSIVAFADDPEFLIDTTDFSGYVGDSNMVWSSMSDGSDFTADVVWNSTDPSVATVEGVNVNCYIGVVTLVGEGSCTITATYNGQQASMTVNVNAYDELPFNTEYPIVDDGSGFMMQFTAPAAGYYTFMVTQTDCEVYGGANSMMGNSSFGIDADGVPSYAAIYLEANEVSLVNGIASLWNTTLTEAHYSLKVIASPAATGYALSESEISMDFFNDAIREHAMVELLADPDTAPTLTDCLWEIGDNTIVDISYYENECYLSPLKPGTTTLTVSKADGTPIQTIPVEVKDISADVVEMNWGVLYDYDPEVNYNIFTFTPAKDDVYTLESFFEAEEGVDPVVDVYVKENGEWTYSISFDDQYDPNTFMTTSMNFKGELTATAGTEYMFCVNNYEKSAYSFSIKGTDASDPGYNPVKVAAKDPTCTEDGNIEHYKCSVTGLLFANAEGTRMAGDVVVKATGHKLEKVEATKDTIAHEKCSVCEALFVDGKEVTSVDNPKTGDNTMLLPLVGLVMLSATGLAITVIGKKRAY